MMAEENMPEFKAEIEGPKYEVRLNDHSGYLYSAKTPEEAEKLGQELVKKAEDKWKEEHSRETLNQERLERLDRNIQNYIEMLTKELWHDTRNKYISPDMKNDIVVLKKHIRDNLKEMHDDKIQCDWHQSYTDDSTYYSFSKRETE